MKDKTEQNRHENLIKFVQSAMIAYSVFAIFLVIVKLTIEKTIPFLYIGIYGFLYLTAILLFYISIKKRFYLKISSDKNFFIIPSLVGLILGQYYFLILGNARWIYILVLAVSYLGVTYQNYKVVLGFSLSSATANLTIIGIIHLTKWQDTNVFSDLLVVATHYILAFFMIPITRFFNTISENYREILHVLRDRNHIIEKDLELAYTIQKSLLPAEYPRQSGVQIASKYIPMDVVGGDFYDFIEIDDKESGIFISDVSGHGVPAALITSMIKVAVSSLNKRVITKPGKFCQVINEALIDKTATNFITAFYCIYNSEAQTLRFSNAGHCQPILYRKKTGEMHLLATDGIILGVFSDVNIEEKSIKVEKGDRLILYTDGLIETQNSQREFYSVNGLKNFIIKNSETHITEFVHCLFEDVKNWSTIKGFEDDIVIIGIDFT